MFITKVSVSRNTVRLQTVVNTNIKISSTLAIVEEISQKNEYACINSENHGDQEKKNFILMDIAFLLLKKCKNILSLDHT